MDASIVSLPFSFFLDLSMFRSVFELPSINRAIFETKNAGSKIVRSFDSRERLHRGKTITRDVKCIGIGHWGSRVSSINCA